MLVSALEKIEKWLVDNNPTLANALQPGLDNQEITNKLMNVNFNFPEEFYTVYNWHNGVGSGIYRWQSCVFPGYGLISLEQGLDWYHDFLEINKHVEVEIWRPEWYPIFAFDIKDIYSLILQDAKTESCPVTRIYTVGENIIAAPSLTKLIEAIADCYENDIFFSIRKASLIVILIRLLRYSENMGATISLS
ncbi:MAG: SMI1/KNR4 family protein [Synechococcaceae cyanobacterium SM2_3_1]|nr:SMI1/KNR4 family protein [Synechococcaceae cyanobacterium SM2_3_1]